MQEQKTFLLLEKDQRGEMEKKEGKRREGKENEGALELKL